MTIIDDLTGRRHPSANSSIWRRPFTLETWTWTAYLLVSGVISLVVLLFVLVGRPATGARLQSRLATVLRVVPAAAAPPRAPAARVALHAIGGIPLGMASLVITAYGWALVLLNVAYPIRSGSDLSGAWGGPSLAGAWAVHGAAGLAFLFIVPWMISALIAGHRRALGWLGTPG
jgi:hypothetical protein